MAKASEPAWLTAAQAKLGTREIPGRTHNNALLAFLNTAAKWNGVVWRDDEMPWCGGFVAACLVAAGVEPVKIAARAKSWAGWGALLRPGRLAPGAVLVFEREGGGHVGFYVGEDASTYHVLGGNQGNAVSITRIAKSRLVASRWPRGYPVNGGPVQLAANSRPVSSNEA
jgi:uncharacterized protein (TIGR02594 family)